MVDLNTQEGEMTKATKTPDRWLQGAMLTRERAGMTPGEALRDAIRHWLEQEAMARECGHA